MGGSHAVHGDIGKGNTLGRREGDFHIGGVVGHVVVSHHISAAGGYMLRQCEGVDAAGAVNVRTARGEAANTYVNGRGLVAFC